MERKSEQRKSEQTRSISKWSVRIKVRECVSVLLCSLASRDPIKHRGCELQPFWRHYRQKSQKVRAHTQSPQPLFKVATGGISGLEAHLKPDLTSLFQRKFAGLPPPLRSKLARSGRSDSRPIQKFYTRLLLPLPPLLNHLDSAAGPCMSWRTHDCTRQASRRRPASSVLSAFSDRPLQPSPCQI